jgi:predicted histone-like DNA-binding protein
MAISFVKVKKNINFGSNPGEKFVARIFRNQDISIERIATDISESTTIGYPDVVACLKAMEIQVSKHILNGSAVKFGYLGSFIPHIKAKSQESVDLVDAESIKRVSCRFLPSASFKHSLKKCSFKEADLNIKNLIK